MQVFSLTSLIPNVRNLRQQESVLKGQVESCPCILHQDIEDYQRFLLLRVSE
jgi:hypothetical protein